MKNSYTIKFDPYTTWFTSDYHLYHNRIISLSSRPFSSVMEMNEEIRDRHNALVGKKDAVFNLGDLMLLPKNVTQEEINEAIDFLKTFNGVINYIPGNHERHTYYVNLPNWIHRAPLLNICSLDDSEQGIVLCHFSLRTWNKAHHGTWHLFGHSHGGLKDDNGERFSDNKKSLSMDVGVDTNNYKPYSYQDIKTIMSTKEFSPVDHHGLSIARS